MPADKANATGALDLICSYCRNIIATLHETGTDGR
jgi:hypothetical protein